MAFYFWWNEAARLHFTPFASCRISGNRKSSSLKKRRFFFTSSQNLRSLACEVVQRQGLCLAFLRLNSLSLHLWRGQLALPVKFLPGGSKVGDVITARLRRLNFPYTLPNATFSADFLSFSILGSRPRPKVWLIRHRTWFSETHTFAMQIIKLPTVL